MSLHPGGVLRVLHVFAVKLRRLHNLQFATCPFVARVRRAPPGRDGAAIVLNSRSSKRCDTNWSMVAPARQSARESRVPKANQIAEAALGDLLFDPPAPARFVRVYGVKSDGPGQKRRANVDH